MAEGVPNEEGRHNYRHREAGASRPRYGHSGHAYRVDTRPAPVGRTRFTRPAIAGPLGRWRAGHHCRPAGAETHPGGIQ